MVCLDPMQEKHCVEWTYKDCNFWILLSVMEFQKAAEDSENKEIIDDTWVHCSTNTAGFLSQLSK